MFNHLNIKIADVAKQVSIDDTGGPRLYKTPYGKVFPSITTILSPLKREILEKWRKRVGDKVADAEGLWGRERGTAIHLAAENVLNNESIIGHPLLVRMLIQDLMPYLRRIDNIHCQEQPLYSDYFETAGRCDTIGEYGGKLSVIDFKGSKRTKKIGWVQDYFLQVSFYAYAYWERTGMKIEQGVILIANEQGQASEFIVNPWEYWKELKVIRKQYKDEFGI